MSKYGFVGHFGRRCSVGLCFSYGPKWQGSEQIVAVVDAKNERRLIRIMAILSSLSQTAVC